MRLFSFNAPSKMRILVVVETVMIVMIRGVADSERFFRNLRENAECFPSTTPHIRGSLWWPNQL
jgi:hypothetical protein